MAEEIKLVGSFTDNITPKLKKLDRELKKITKSFTSVSRGIKKFTKQADKAEQSIDRLTKKVSSGMNRSSKSVRTSAQSWDRYSKSVRRADRAARNFRPPNPGRAPQPMRAPRGRGRGGSNTPMKVPGFGTIATAGFAAGLALEGVSMAANAAASSLGGIVEKAGNFQMDEIGMAGSIQTMANKTFEESMRITRGMMEGLEQAATALPGATEDYLTVASLAMDDLISMFGSVEAVQANTAKGDQSIVAGIGLAANLAQIPTRMLNMDLAQIRDGDFNRVGLFQRIPVLKAKTEAYVAEGFSNFEAFTRALPEALTPQMIAEMKGTISAQIERFKTMLTSPTQGVFGGLREIKIDGMTTTFVKELGLFFNSLEKLAETLLASGADPMVPLTKFIQWMTKLSDDLNSFVAGGGSILDGIAVFFGELGAGFVNQAAQLDYTALVQAIDRFFYELFSGIDWGAVGSKVVEIITAALQSPTGLVLAVGGLVAIVNQAILAFAALKSAMLFIQSLKLGATIAGWLGAVGPTIVALKAGLATLAAGVAAVALPVLAVVGAVLLVIAVIRQWDNILKIGKATLDQFVAAVKWVASYFREAVLKMWGAIFGIIRGIAGKIPGGNMILDALGFKKIEKANERAIKQNEKDRKQAAKDWKDAQRRASEGWTEAGKQTAEDLRAIGDKFKFENENLTDASRPTAKALDMLRRAAERANSNFANNKKFLDEAGQAWGWALKNGEEILVRWGSVAGTMDAVNEAGQNAADALNTIETPEIPEITPPKLPADLTDPNKPLDVSGISDALAEIYGVEPVEVVIPEIKPMERKTILGEMVNGLNNWWNDRKADMGNYDNFVKENPLPEAPKVEVNVEAPEFPEPVDIAPVTQGLTQLEGKQTQAINKIVKTNEALKILNSQVEKSAEKVSGEITKASAANTSALNNVQFALETISGKLTAPFDVKVIGKVTIGNFPKDLGNGGGGGGNRRTANDIDPLTPPNPIDRNDASIPVLPTKLQLPEVVVNQQPVMAKLQLPEVTSPALSPKGRRPLMEILDEMVAQRPVAPKPDFMTANGEAVASRSTTAVMAAPSASPTEITNRDLFTRMAADPSMVTQLVPQSTTTNRNRNFDFSGNLNVSMSGVEKTSKEMANDVAGELLRSIQDATYTDLDLT